MPQIDGERVTHPIERDLQGRAIGPIRHLEDQLLEFSGAFAHPGKSQRAGKTTCLVDDPTRRADRAGRSQTRDAIDQEREGPAAFAEHDDKPIARPLQDLGRIVELVVVGVYLADSDVRSALRMFGMP